MALPYRRPLAAAALLLAATAFPGFAQGQEKPLSLTGVFTTGVYTANNQNGLAARVSTVPAILKLNLDGYLGHPDFLSYRVRPQLSAGEQATDAGFITGNGLTLTTTFLRQRSFPLTLTYSNLQREEITYGSLTRISGLRSVSHDRNFGLQWLLRDPRLPRLSFDLGRSRNTLRPEDPLIPQYDSLSRHYTLGINDHLWGWRLDGRLRWDRFSSDFANPLKPDFITTELDRRTSQYRFTADRPLGKHAQVVLTGGAINSRNTFNDRPFDQDVRFFNGMLNFGWGERWRGSFRSGYNSNLLGTDIQQALSQLTGGGGAGTPGAQALALVPFETRVSSLSLSGDVRFQAHRDWSLFGSLSQNNVRTPDDQIAASQADYLTGSSGVSFNRSFSWATLTSQYSLDVGRLDFADIADSRILGHAFSLVAQRGTVDRLELTGSYNASTQRVDQVIILRTTSQSADFTAGRRVSTLVVRGGLGIQRSSFQDGGIDYDANGLTFRGSVEHQRFQVHYFRNVVDANTFQPFLTNLPSSAGASAVLLGAPVRLVLTTLRTQTLTLQTNPWRRLEAKLSWTAGRQNLDQQINNDYDLFDLRVRYRFRLLTFEVGYARYDQSFLALSQFKRSRFFFRVERPFLVF
ncbi:MAG: hypothetical protein ACE5HL_05710 [Terriglobia bacterium]